MTAFAQKTVLLGVCGSIAAYKACELASRLREQGASVVCALTGSAQKLVQAATFEALTGNRAVTEMFSPFSAPEVEHISLARKADLFLVAPATANMIAKAAHGIADDWISTTLLATRAPIIFAPAMNTQMYTHPATQSNLALLRQRGVLIVEPASGRLACGEEGPGRLADIPDILDAARIAMTPVKDYAGKRVLITSGPNHEPIDPMRYIGNRSSGKMGYALALEALCRGAEVCVISGPALVSLPRGATVVKVSTAGEMYDAVMSRVADFDIIIGAAAVADYRVECPLPAKIKRQDEPLSLRLLPNRDIIAAVAAAKRPEQKVVGFAAESNDLIKHGEQKLLNKRLDMLVANTIGGDQCAVGADKENAFILVPGKPAEELVQIEKSALATLIFDRLAAI